MSYPATQNVSSYLSMGQAGKLHILVLVVHTQETELSRTTSLHFISNTVCTEKQMLPSLQMRGTKQTKW